MPRDTASRYGLGTYLRGRALAVACALASLVIMAFMLALLQVGAQAIAIVAVFAAIPPATALVVGYARARGLYGALVAAADDPELARNLSSSVEKPRFPEGRIAWEALESQADAFLGEIGEQRQEVQAYRDYVELWVHEVKTPIAAARLILDGRHDERAERLSAEVDRIERQVEAALYYARSTSLASDYAIREVPLADAVRSVCRRNARLLIGRGVTPRVEVPDDVRVLADRQWVEFVVSQIVVNAANYGASRIGFSVEERDGEDGAATVLEISDDGCGIPAADMPRIFERGFTGSNGKARGSSTGMGLYLVSTMCQKMGLGLLAASERGRGTRMLVSFPHDRRLIAPRG